MHAQGKIAPDDIIKAFDEILDFIYGRSRGRDYPSKFDHKTAGEWIELGLTVPIASYVFSQRMTLMHERWLRQTDPHDKTNIPQHLGVFDENIRSAIHRMKAGGEVDMIEKNDSKWRMRIKSWLKNPSFWQQMRDHWGEPPDHPEFRGPRKLRDQMLAEHRASQEKKKTSHI